MFKKTRKKIVAAIMTILIILWSGTLGIIYVSSYMDMKKQNEQMLEAHAQMYNISQPLRDEPPKKPEYDSQAPEFAQTPMFKMSTFYTVAISYEGEKLEIKNGPPTIHTDEELEKLAQNVIKSGEVRGTKSNLMYYVTDKGGYILVVFMDNTVINENVTMLFRYTLIFGVIAIFIFFFVSIFLARKIVYPLETSYKKQKQFISDAGHELKTPVAVVGANAEILYGEIGENQWLANIVYENERMGILVGQLLELARTENISPKMEQLDFGRLVYGEILPFEGIAFEKGLIINSDIAEGYIIDGNSAQLKQLVSILLDNAIRHSNGGNKIDVKVTKEHGHVILSVINPGDEITGEQKREIFERFYRIDTARNSEDRHYGLGLSIAKAIVNTHKGRIEVLSYNNLIEFKIYLSIKLQ